jgi:hypothetical protein
MYAASGDSGDIGLVRNRRGRLPIARRPIAELAVVIAAPTPDGSGGIDAARVQVIGVGKRQEGQPDTANRFQGGKGPNGGGNGNGCGLTKAGMRLVAETVEQSPSGLGANLTPAPDIPSISKGREVEALLHGAGRKTIPLDLTSPPARQISVEEDSTRRLWAGPKQQEFKIACNR